MVHNRLTFTTSTCTGPTLGSLDLAIDTLRTDWSRLIPLYLWAMLPFSGAMVLLIDAVSSEHRAALPFACFLLTAATVWRWIWLSVFQRSVQNRLRGEAATAVWRRLPTILLTRAFCSLGLTWGSVLLIPGFYSLFLAGFAAPLFLEEDGPGLRQIRTGLGYINGATGRLIRIALALSLSTLLLLVGMGSFQVFLVKTVLPEFLGINTSALEVTVFGGTWMLCTLYLLFLILDLLWTTASVFLFYDLQARRLGSDLRGRIQAIREATE
ncbi:MAG: hypothetical protein ACYTGH_20100 [Planctomycetota bacterium]|jgi:hypothetical protein